ncbi:carbon starvation CstA family protein [Natronobacterium gregoryi]|uniref:Carbon starvation protein A n=3 Tax=Natronobacterium gregoryi TaxID=44930 RepID=L0ALD1_NATGS|nr:carbon starvation CstA family protein [Natronobacterium gregoryi]AFZ74693.1 carbon starvation protein, predicted membrane protein [Natronobacterium gregoryi SP2]PLK20938.1 carbon starvation protein A [Natronobacterium gregoryi SP2]SFJ04703.1 carbon starvation protein [Natronobacterium gregoryi]
MVGVIWIVALVLVMFTAAYVVYGRYLSQFVDLDDSRETPAHKYQDGQEYVPAKKSVLLGHHYSSIAGGAPVVGPITAALIWGWLPALLWVAIGNPLIGAVHDFVSLSGSLRHEGKSIGYIIGEYVGERGKNMLLWFAFLLTILVVAVFALVIGVVFDAFPEAATASIVYIGLAFLFGFWLYQLGLPFSVGTVVFVAGVFASVWVGIQFPVAITPPAEAGAYPEGTFVVLDAAPTLLPEFLGSANITAWVLVVLVYGAAASILPVWMLLQPRDYLSSFLLYTGVGGGLLAVIVGTFVTGMGDDAVHNGQQLSFDITTGAWYGFLGQEGPLAVEGLIPLMPLFPLLFLTIACGTISGFHSLVSSGTTAKQLNKETDARLIGYGGMLGEGLLAAVALCAVTIVAIPAADGGIGLALPNFATGGGAILTAFGIPFEYAAPFMALVLASFLLTSMDTAVRLGRYMLEEIIDTPETQIESYGANPYVNTTIITIIAFFLLGSGQWEDLWVLFGGANQLLASLALLTGTIWLANWQKSKQLISTGGPMILMAFITVFGLTWLALYQILGGRLLGITGGMEPAESLLVQVSGVVQIVIIAVLLGLALSLFKIGYDNMKAADEAEPDVAAGTSDDD